MFGGLSLVSLVPALGLITASSAYPNSTIAWSACGDSPPLRECGSFEVPLDYHNISAGTANLAVLRVNATKLPRLGTLFVNPGGPGQQGVLWLQSGDVEQLIQKSGGQYDLISWDPRGTNNLVSLESGDSIRVNPLEVRSDFQNRTARQDLYSHVDEVDNAMNEFFKICKANSGSTLQYMGTAATVRDMVLLHDYLAGGVPINYWGFSYGTLLGSYFVNMFPERVGRVILDGVVNPWVYASRPPLDALDVIFTSPQKVLSGFAKKCASAGPDRCAMAKVGSTTDSILRWIVELLELAYDHAQATNDTDLSSATLRTYVFNSLYRPDGWKIMAQDLFDISVALRNSTSHTTNLSNLNARHVLQPVSIKRRSGLLDCSAPAITCSDSIDNPDVTTRDMFEFIVNVTDNRTKILGPFAWVFPNTYCHKWPARAVERYTGPFNHKLANRILVIGNYYDPVTPIGSATRVTRALGESAVLLKLDAYGHTSLAVNSSCADKATLQYLNVNKLPENGFLCKTNQILF